MMYKLYKDSYGNVSTAIILISDNVCIPPDEANTDYQAFLLWKSQGNEPLPADA